MKKLTKSLLTSMAIVLILAGSAFSADSDSKQPKEKTRELKEQTICPVMGNKINKELFTDIQGQRVYFCCAGCIEPMKSDPDKYFKKAAENGVRFENIQTLCPVSGEKIDSTATIYYEGRTVSFCCNGCIAEFEKDPQQYLHKLDNPSAKDAQEDKHKSDMPGMHGN